MIREGGRGFMPTSYFYHFAEVHLRWTTSSDNHTRAHTHVRAHTHTPVHTHTPAHTQACTHTHTCCKGIMTGMPLLSLAKHKSVHLLWSLMLNFRAGSIYRENISFPFKLAIFSLPHQTASDGSLSHTDKKKDAWQDRESAMRWWISPHSKEMQPHGSVALWWMSLVSPSQQAVTLYQQFPVNEYPSACLYTPLLGSQSPSLFVFAYRTEVAGTNLCDL